MKTNGLRSAFNWMMAMFAIIVCSTACEKLNADEQTTSEFDPATPVVGGYVYEVDLNHYLDSALKVKVSDQMTASLDIWRTEDGVKKDKVFSNQENPRLDAYSELARKDYTITPEQVDIRPTNVRIARGPESKDSNGHFLELDTVYLDYPDGQVESIPVKITTHTVEYDGHVYYYPSVTLIRADFVHLKNTDITSNAHTRGAYVAKVYNTEYKVNLILQETKKLNPKTFALPIYAFTPRSVVQNDAIDNVVAENKTQVPLDSITESCTFDRVTTWKSGEQTREKISIILQRKVGKRDPYRKDVQNFNHYLASVNPLQPGVEAQNRTEGNWTVWRKTDVYSANIENGVYADRVATEYPLMHERATYKDDHLEVSFDYVDFRVTEKSTTVTPRESDRNGYTEALLDNKIATTYIGYPQDAFELVYLYKPEKKAVSRNFENPSLVVYRDSVVGNIDVVTIFDDGTKSKVHDHINAPRSLRVLTDWESYQKIASQATSDVSVSLTSSENVTKGNWKYANQTEKLRTDATLYDGSTQQNGWEVVVPNAFVYTYEGETYTFDNIPFSAKQISASLNFRADKDGYSLYDYGDAIDVIFGSDTQRSTAPGLVKIANNAVKGYDVRNKQLVITPEKVIASLDFITQFTNGTETTDPVSREFPRSLTPVTDWTAYENSITEFTSEPTATISSTVDKQDDEWQWKERTRNISALVTLASSQQNNGWVSVDPDEIVFTRQGISANFGTFDFTVIKVSSYVNLVGTDAQSDNFGYQCTISTTLSNAMASNTQNSTAPGKIVVQKGKEVTGHEIRNPQLVVTDDYVRASLSYVTLFSDGSEEAEPVSRDFARSLSPYTDWTAKEKNIGELTGSAAVKLKSSEKIKDGDWEYENKKRDITTGVSLASSEQVNGWISVDPDAIVFNRNGDKYAFKSLNFSAVEAGHEVKLVSETDKSSTYGYSDKINVTLEDNTKSSVAPGTIIVDKEVTVTGYKIENPKMVVNKDNVTTSLTWVTIYSDGTKKSEELNKIFSRNFKVLSNWSSKEEDNSQTTSNASVSITNSSDRKDGNWSYKNKTRRISTTAKLKGSTQKNEWESLDPDEIVFSKEGQTHNFGSIPFTATSTGATVKQKSANNDEAVYSYASNISVAYGSNSQNSSAPGTITVDKPWDPDFPVNYGKFKSVAVTASQDETYKTWLYVVSIHFENGTLPLLIRRNAGAPDKIDTSMFDSSTDSRLNSAFYITSKKKWINAIADDVDSKKHMVWKDVDGHTPGMLVYSTATMWGWDGGYTKNNHPTVFTKTYSAKLSNNNTVLTIYDSNGKVFATYKSAK